MPQSEPCTAHISIFESIVAWSKIADKSAELATPFEQLLRGEPLAVAHAARQGRATLAQCRQALRTDTGNIELWIIYFALLAELRPLEAS
jgi:hypothetical protein